MASVSRGWLAALSIIAATLTLLPPAIADNTSVTIFAAASLKGSLDEVAQQWRRETGKTVTLTYAASSALAKQIEQGAPADIFISADEAWMDYLDERKLILGPSRRALLGNTLVLIAPAASELSVTVAPGLDLGALLGDGRLAMADIAAVPAGKYGKASLEALSIWPSVEDKVAQAENVRAALHLVALGEAPLGIVYETDAKAEPRVKVVGTFPDDTHPPIIYPAAQVTASTSADATALLVYLASANAGAIFAAHGFRILN